MSRPQDMLGFLALFRSNRKFKILSCEAEVKGSVILCPVTDSADQQERIDKKPQKRYRNATEICNPLKTLVGLTIPNP